MTMPSVLQSFSSIEICVCCVWFIDQAELRQNVAKLFSTDTQYYFHSRFLLLWSKMIPIKSTFPSLNLIATYRLDFFFIFICLPGFTFVCQTFSDFPCVLKNCISRRF